GVDTTRTALAGDTETLHFAKYGGGIVVFETSYQRISPGYEINDVGFLNRADWQDQSTWVALQFLRKTKLYDQLRWNFNQWQDWTSAGDLLLERAVNTNGHVQFHNNSWLHLGGTVGQLGTTFSDRATRGVRHSPFAHLDQTPVGLTARVDYTASPTLTLQIYANPFVSKGTYSDVREVVNARADHYADRFAPYGDAAVTGNPGAFNFKE